MDETMKQIQYVASHSILLFGTLQMAIELRGFLSMQEIGHNLTISDFVPVMKDEYEWYARWNSIFDYIPNGSMNSN